MKKLEANKLAYKYQPKAFQLPASEVAKDFVNLQKTTAATDFRIADVVAQQSGIKEIEQKNIEAKVEDTVLERLKEIQEQAYAQAYDLGKIEGAEKAFEEKRAELADRLTEMDKLLKTIDELTKTIAKEAETTIVRMIYQIAERIAMREINMDPAPIVGLLNDLVHEVQGAENVLVKMNPEDCGFIEDLRKRGVKEVENLMHIKLQPVNEIHKGGCVIETNYGAIDATVEQRVEKAWTVVESKLPAVKKDADPTDKKDEAS